VFSKQSGKKGGPRNLCRQTPAAIAQSYVCASGPMPLLLDCLSLSLSLSPSLRESFIGKQNVHNGGVQLGAVRGPLPLCWL